MPAPPMTVEFEAAPLAKTKRFPDASPVVTKPPETIIVLAIPKGVQKRFETPYG